MLEEPEKVKYRNVIYSRLHDMSVDKATTIANHLADDIDDYVRHNMTKRERLMRDCLIILGCTCAGLITVMITGA